MAISIASRWKKMYNYYFFFETDIIAAILTATYYFNLKHGCRVGWRFKYNNFCLQKYTTLYNLFKKLTNGSSLVLCKHCKPNYYYSSFWWLPICCYMNYNIILLHWLLLMRMGMLFSLNIFILFNFFFLSDHYRNNNNIVKKCNIRFKPNSILFRLT